MLKQIGKKGKGKAGYPNKQYINILDGMKSDENRTLEILIFIIFLIALAAFTKFGVIDKISEASAAEAAYNEVQRQITELKEQNADYDKVKKDYSHYGLGYLDDTEILLVDREDVLDLLDKYVLKNADIKTLNVTDNTVTLTVEKTRLNAISSIVKELEADPDVAFVTVNVAGTDRDVNAGSGNKQVTATMYIELVPNGGEQ
ncbi:MAG: hypothetical protein MR908_00165 [Firmicutes bacterium]|nr:hypothetical protein [Bacillota bacterium]